MQNFFQFCTFGESQQKKEQGTREIKMDSREHSWLF